MYVQIELTMISGIARLVEREFRGRTAQQDAKRYAERLKKQDTRISTYNLLTYNG